MQIPVLIEPVNSNGYRASTGQPLALTAEGSTREEALQQLHQALQQRLRAGAEVVSFELGDATTHPVAPYFGMFKDNPLFDAWQQAIADRRLADEAEKEERI